MPALFPARGRSCGGIAAPSVVVCCALPTGGPNSPRSSICLHLAPFGTSAECKQMELRAWGADICGLRPRVVRACGLFGPDGVVHLVEVLSVLPKPLVQRRGSHGMHA